ncbi:MAG: ABC transporter ATP-binding protein [Verrucomicrobiota bacterium]
MPRLVLEDLTKTFPALEGKTFAAVDNVSLTVADRELLALVGPSGSGKTTLLRLIAGLESPELGKISFDAQNVTWQSPRDHDVALVFQSHALFPHFTAFENIAFGLKLRGVPADQIAARVHETATLLGVAHCLDRPPAKLSGGERQRVALGRALIREPKVLLLDEPFANLDEPLRAQLRAELPMLRQRFATTIIFVTHDQEEALALGDRVAVIRNGALQQVGTPREIYESPANRFVAAFIGSPTMNLFHGTIAQRESYLVFLGAEPDDFSLPQFQLELGGARADWFGANVGRKILLGFRPEHIALMDEAAAPRHPKPLAGTVKSVEFLGAATHCRVQAGERLVTLRIAPNVSLQPGQAVQLAFDVRHAHVFDAATGVAHF